MSKVQKLRAFYSIAEVNSVTVGEGDFAATRLWKAREGSGFFPLSHCYKLGRSFTDCAEVRKKSTPHSLFCTDHPLS